MMKIGSTLLEVCSQTTGTGIASERVANSQNRIAYTDSQALTVSNSGTFTDGFEQHFVSRLIEGSQLFWI